MTMYLAADANGNFWLYETYPHRFQDEWVPENVGDASIPIEEHILVKFGIEPPTFESDPIPVSFTLKTYSD